MAINKTLTEIFTNIANAIRNKTGKNDKIVANELSNTISNFKYNYNITIHTNVKNMTAKLSKDDIILTSTTDNNGDVSFIVNDSGNYKLLLSYKNYSSTKSISI